MNEAINATVRVFAVILGNMGRVTSALDKLNKRAARKGIAPLVFSWGKPYTETVTRFFENADDAPAGARFLGADFLGKAGQYSFDLSKIPLTLENRIPKYEGWSFVAALQHLEGENIVRSIPGETVPEIYRSRGSQCDHCKVNRRRIDTYVVRHDDGRHVQVGSTCIADFLGSDDAGKLAAQASYLAEATSLAEGGESEECGSPSQDRALAELLSYVSLVIRAHGWVSRTAAREGRGAATADIAWSLMTSPYARKDWRKATGEDPIPTEADIAAADQAEEWAETLSDTALNAERGDYLHNVRAIARTGLVTFRTAGLGGSILTAWERAIGKARQAKERADRPTCNEYIGRIKDKLGFGALPKTKGYVLASPEPLTLDFVAGYESSFGYVTVLKFRTTQGHTIVWKVSDTDLSRQDVGKRYTLSGIVKKHDEYKGAKQTVMSHCKATEIPVIASDAA